VEAPHQTKGNKDEDVTWAKKRNETHYGYKDNIKVDKDSKIITNFTSYNGKSTRGIKEISKLTCENDKEIYERYKDMLARR
jgi:hypothetical protein